MKRVILIKYGELSTKKGNLNFFIKTLSHMIEDKLKGYSISIVKDRARMRISFDEKDLEDIQSILQKIFGIHTYHIAYVCESNSEAIKGFLFIVRTLIVF